MKNVLRSLLLVSLFFTAPAAYAQADAPYAANKPCRFYVINKQPAPVRCLQELAGSWGSHTYISEGFVFRDKEDYQLWRGREDFRRAAGLSQSPAAASPPKPPAAAKTGARTLLCPGEVTVKFAAASVEGWRLDEREAIGHLDPSNPPHSSGAILTCYYALGSQRGAFMLNRSVTDGDCTPRGDGTGFDCNP